MTSPEKLLDIDEEDESVLEENPTDDGKSMSCAFRLYTFFIYI